MKVKFEYQVTKDTLRAELIATGDKRDARRNKEFELIEFSAEQRQVVVDTLGSNNTYIDLCFARATASAPSFGSDPTRPNSWLTEQVDLYLPYDPSADDVFSGIEKKNAIEGIEKSKAEALAEQARAAKEADYRNKLALFIETWDILAPDGEHLTDDEAILKSVTVSPSLDRFTPRKEDRTSPVHDIALYTRFQSIAKEQLDTLRKQRRESERSRWIEAHGSRRLKLSLEKGYDCQRAYVEERAAIEAPGFFVDFNDRCEWKERFSPSEAALDILEEAEGRSIGDAQIVWLTNVAGGIDGWDYLDEPCEAIVIRRYLDKYDLVKPL